MKRDVTLTVTSLLSILFFTFHLADDIVRGMEPGSSQTSRAVPTFVFWLYGTLVLLGERRSGTSSLSSEASFRWSSPLPT